MLQKNKLVLTGIALAVMSVMNTAQADLVCGTAAEIKASTGVTTLQINNCGAEVQSDPIKLAALASLVAETPALSSAAAGALAEGGKSAEDASNAFTTIINDPNTSDELKAEVATAAATVVVENADKTIKTSDGTSAPASAEITALLGTINSVDSTIVATVVEEVKQETIAAAVKAAEDKATTDNAGKTVEEIATAVKAAGDAAKTTAEAEAAANPSPVVAVNASPAVVAATETAVAAAETAAANNNGTLGAVLTAAGVDLEATNGAAFYTAIGGITGVPAFANGNSGCTNVVLFGMFPTSTCK